MTKNIKKASFYTIIGKIISKIIGLLRERISKTLFGLSPEMSIFVFVLTLIGLIRSISIKSISRVLVPYILRNKKDNTVFLSGLSLITLINIIIGLLFIFLNSLLAQYTLGNLTSSPSLFQFAQMMYILGGILIILLSISDTLESTASGFRVFIYQIIREPVINIVYIGILIAIPVTTSLMGGRLVGEIVFLLLIITGIIRRKLLNLVMPRIYHMTSILLLSIPVIVGTSINFINTFADRYMATLLPDSRSVSALGAATTIAIIPYALFGESISKSIYTGFSESGSQNDTKKFSEYIGKTLYLGGLLVIPSSIGIAVLSKNIVYFLYFGGRFTMEDVQLVTNAVIFYAFRYLFTSLYVPINNSLITLNKSNISMILAAIFVPINILLNWFLGFRLKLGITGLALSTAITSFIMLITIMIIIYRIIKEPFPPEYKSSIIKVLLSGTIMGVILIFLKNFFTINRIDTVILIILGSIIYFLSLWLLKDKETVKAINFIKGGSTGENSD